MRVFAVVRRTFLGTRIFVQQAALDSQNTFKRGAHTQCIGIVAVYYEVSKRSQQQRSSIS